MDLDWLAGLSDVLEHTWVCDLIDRALIVQQHFCWTNRFSPLSGLSSSSMVACIWSLSSFLLGHSCFKWPFFPHPWHVMFAFHESSPPDWANIAPSSDRFAASCLMCLFHPTDGMYAIRIRRTTSGLSGYSLVPALGEHFHLHASRFLRKRQHNQN